MRRRSQHPVPVLDLEPLAIPGLVTHPRGLSWWVALILALVALGTLALVALYMALPAGRPPATRLPQGQTEPPIWDGGRPQALPLSPRPSSGVPGGPRGRLPDRPAGSRRAPSPVW